MQGVEQPPAFFCYLYKKHIFPAFARYSEKHVLNVKEVFNKSRQKTLTRPIKHHNEIIFYLIEKKLVSLQL